MNPYLEKEGRLNQKAGEWSRLQLKGKNPYSEEAYKTALQRFEWDNKRIHEFKENNNSSFRDYFVKIGPGDLVLRLHPRVKLVYDQIRGPPINPQELAFVIRDRFTMPEASVKPVYIDLDDVRKEIPFEFCLPSFKPFLFDKQKSVMAIYFRDFSFIDQISNPVDENEIGPIDVARNFVLNQEIVNISIDYNYRQLVYKGRVPLAEDAHEMIRQFNTAYPGYMERRRPLMIVHNLLAEDWFSHSNAFKFFNHFGEIRHFSVVIEEGVYIASIEYHSHSDFMRVLKILTCCSIVSNYPYLQEYEISLALSEAPIGIASSLYPDRKERNKLERRHAEKVRRSSPVTGPSSYGRQATLAEEIDMGVITKASHPRRKEIRIAL